MLREKFITLTKLKKKEIFKICYLSVNLKNLGKENQINPKVNRKKKINIRAQINTKKTEY